MISVCETVAKEFRLKNLTDVRVTLVVDRAEVTLDLIELMFREQYVTRSDMYRLRRRLLGACLHANKKIEHYGMRTMTGEMWHAGVRVTCGYVDESTRIVFRSNSVSIFMFVQLSAEMWQFDPAGDLYFEKLVNGFLPRLLERWSADRTSHYVSVVALSRWYYTDKDEFDAFPAAFKARTAVDAKGRRFMDFYRLLVQNEHYENWSHLVSQLRSVFYGYTQSIEQFHRRQLNTDAPPKMVNSVAADGSFLEVLNISMNAFNLQAFDRR